MKRVIIQSTIALLTLMLVGSALGQGSQYGRLTVEREIQRTQQFLEQVREAVMSADVPQAQALLEQARENQQKAVDAFQGDQLLIAARYTKAAREQAKTALSLARRVEQYDGAVQRQLEIAGDLLERVDQALGQQDRRGLRQMYETLRDNLSTGWEFYRQREYKPAYKLANQVENAARKMLAALGPQGGNPQEYERRREHLLQLYNDAREQLSECDSDVANAYHEQARQAYELAEQMHRDGHTDQALETLQRARQLVLQASRECLGDRQLEQQFERLRAELDRLTEAAADADPAVRERVRALLGQAEDHLKRAREQFQAGQTESTAAALKAASLTLKQIRSIMVEAP